MENNVATVKSIYEAFGKGDIPGIIDCLADEVQWEQWADNSSQKAGIPWMLARKGKEGALDFFDSVSKLKVKDLQVLSIMANENQVAVELVFETEVPSSGGHFRDEELHLWTFNKDGKVIRLRHYTDTAKHIAANKHSD